MGIIKSAIAIIALVFSLLLITTPVAANPIITGFGAGTQIATPKGNIAVEELNSGDRVMGYNFEFHRYEENIIRETRQKVSLSIYSINHKTKLTSSLIYIKTAIKPELVRLHKLKLGDRLFAKNLRTVESIEQIVSPTNIYQIKLANPQGNLYADDFLVQIGTEVPPFFRRGLIDCSPGTPYFRQCSDFNADTLPEYMIALSILAIGLLAVGYVLPKFFIHTTNALRFARDLVQKMFR